jgi:ABC-2 type transport system ATP-binding protein
MVANSPAGRIDVAGLTKSFGAVRAVDQLSFTVEPGSVTGFLGPNGAGKTTTLRMLLGLVTPDAGAATIGGRSYAELPAPADQVGAVLEATGFHPARSGREHLRVYCTVNGYRLARADQVLELVGLTGAGRRAVRGYSLGMRQRLALAGALLGDPPVLVLDEPANGLDPEGIAWLRGLLRGLAEDGRTVLVSSHVLSEVQQLVDRVVIVNHGQLVRQGTLADLSGQHQQVVSVRTPSAEQLLVALGPAGQSNGVRVERTGPQTLRVTGMPAAQVGELAFAAGVRLHELTPERSGLEAVFFALTATGRQAAAATGQEGREDAAPARQ